MWTEYASISDSESESIWPNICARILFVFVFSHSEKTNIIHTYSYSVKILIPNNIRIRIWSKKQYSLTSESVPQIDFHFYMSLCTIQQPLQL